MSLRMRLAAAFFILLVAPIAVVAALVYLAISDLSRPDPQNRGVRTVIAATCQRLGAEADALAAVAAVRQQTYAVTGDAPQPWAICGVGSTPLLPAGTGYGGLAARAEIGAGSYAYAVTGIDANLIRQLSAAAGCPVIVVGTGQAPTQPDQPLPLVCATSSPASGGLDWYILPVGLVAVIVATAFSWWLACLATRPLSRLLRAVERIVAGDLTARPTIGGRDEAARLGAGLDVLVGGMREAQRLSLTDALTGLGNVRRLRESLRVEAERAARFGRCLGVLMLDLDHFKEVNDAHGHRAGDAVLVELAERVRTVLREVDLMFRAGGEEFVVLLPETDIGGSRTAAIRINEAVRDTPFAVTRSDGEPALVAVTVSVGVAVFPRHALIGSDLLDAADRAMYVAKTAGRDTFALAGAPAPEPRGDTGGVGLTTGGASGGTAAPRSVSGR